MAPVANTGDKSTAKMAESRELHQKQKHSGNHQGTYRQYNVTEEEKRVIRVLYTAGYTGYEIEQITGIGKSAVYKWIGRTSASTPAWTDEELQVLVDGYARGWPPKRIAKILDKSELAVRLRMHRYRKALKQDPYKRKVLQVLLAGAKNGVPVGSIIKYARKADVFREVER